jgi:methylase of polypeptide subunit release factors
MQLAQGAEAPLLALLERLAGRAYRFVTPTPATHARVLARPGRAQARSMNLRDVFGWSLPFTAETLQPETFALLREAGALMEADGLFRSKLRVSSIGERLFLHSAYPTEAEDSVFFGPDTYRFVDFLRAEQPCKAGRLVDQGTGAGVGGIMAASMAPGLRVTLLDINPLALRLASINARHAGVEVELVEGADLDAVAGEIDCVIANPPYIMDEGERTYRDGGGMHGAQISFDWTMAAARRIQRGGSMLLYTGVAIVEGRDELREALERDLASAGCTLSYRELDPDVFGEELEQAPYADVERIAIVGAVATKT